VTNRSVREAEALAYWRASSQAKSTDNMSENIDDLEVIAIHTDWPRMRCAACRAAKAQTAPCSFGASADCLSGGGRNCVSLA